MQSQARPLQFFEKPEKALCESFVPRHALPNTQAVGHARRKIAAHARLNLGKASRRWSE